jgi:hypothetical protein
MSDALTNAPQVADLTAGFYDTPSFPASELQRLIRASRPYKLITAVYQPAFRSNYGGANHRAEKGYYDRKWDLKVYQVPRHLRHKAGQLLTEQGFPLVVEWLRSSNQCGWGSRQHSLVVVINLREGTLGVQRGDGA